MLETPAAAVAAPKSHYRYDAQNRCKDLDDTTGAVVRLTATYTSREAYIASPWDRRLQCSVPDAIPGPRSRVHQLGAREGAEFHLRAESAAGSHEVKASTGEAARAEAAGDWCLDFTRGTTSDRTRSPRSRRRAVPRFGCRRMHPRKVELRGLQASGSRGPQRVMLQQRRNNRQPHEPRGSGHARRFRCSPLHRHRPAALPSRGGHS